MSFTKQARVQVLADGVFETLGGGRSAGSFRRTAQYAPQRSYYFDGAEPMNIAALLEQHAPRYALSTDTRHYLFEAIRANTVQPPNENGDAFLRQEMWRFDRKAGAPVYRTYIAKPHHLNHKTDVASEARGLILDAHYDEAAPPLTECPQCNLRTAERANRDDSGLHCKRCNRLVKDEAVIILVGIDTRKDPPYAEGVRTGQLNTGSMGCTCLYTSCNVCRRVATTKAEFCEHIRAAKGQFFARASSSAAFTRTSAQEITRELQKRGHRFIPTDFTWTAFDDGYEVRRAFEACGDVTYDEYSRVAQPADPKARQQEVLQMQLRTAARTRPSSRAAATSTQPTSTRRAKPERQTSDVRIQAPPNEAVVIEPQQDGAVPPEGALPPESPPTGDTGAPAPSGVPGAPGNVPGAAPLPPAAVPGASDAAPGAVPIQQLQPQPGKPPTARERLSPAEMGVGVPGASRGAAQRGTPVTTPKPFESTYGQWQVRAAPTGRVRIVTPDQREAAVIELGARLTTEVLHRRASKIYASLLERGLLETVKAYTAATAPSTQADQRVAAVRVATSIVDGAIDDMEGFDDHEMYSAATDERTTDMRDPREAVPSAVTDDRTTDMADPSKGKPPGSVTEDGLADHDRGGKPPTSTTDEEHPDNQEPRRNAPSSVLDDPMHDHTERLAARRAAGLRVVAQEELSPEGEDLALSIENDGGIYDLKKQILSKLLKFLQSGQYDTESAKKLWKPYVDKGTQRTLKDTKGDPDRKFAPEHLREVIDWLETHHRSLAESGEYDWLFERGAMVVHKSRPDDAWRTAAIEHAPNGRIASLTVAHPIHGARKLSAQDLKHWALATLACSGPDHRDDEEGEAKAAQVEQRLLAHFEAEKAAMVREHEQEKALIARAAVDSFQRALRLVNRRFAVGLEPSPLRTAMETALSVSRAVGVDAATQQPITYPGLSPRLSHYLAAEGYQLGSHDQLEQMMARAAALTEGGAQYLASAEADAAGFRAAPIALTASEVAPPDAVALAAAEARGRAMFANMNVAPVPVGGIDGMHGPMGAPTAKHAAIGAAVGGTRTAGLLNALSGPR